MKVKEVVTYKGYFDDFFKVQPQKVRDKIIKILDVIVYSYDIDPHSYDVDPPEEDRIFKEQPLFACKQAVV